MSSQRLSPVDDEPDTNALLRRATTHAGLDPFEAASPNAPLPHGQDCVPVGPANGWNLGDDRGGHCCESREEHLGAGNRGSGRGLPPVVAGSPGAEPTAEGDG